MKNESGLNPTGIRVVVRLPALEKVSQGGIILPETVHEAEEKAQTSSILIAAGEDAWKCKEMAGIKTGDKVFFARYAGAGCEFKREGRIYRTMNATDVIGKVEADFDSQFQAALGTTDTFGINKVAA